MAKSVLFVCYGNINRSAVACVLAEKIFEDSGIRFESSGFHPEGGRPADQVMVTLAASKGIDLTLHRSKKLTEEMVDIADLILVMEVAHLRQIETFRPSALAKTFLLGTAGASNRVGLEILDPYGMEIGKYVDALESICHAVGCLKGGYFQD